MGTNIYRTQVLSQPYTQVNCNPTCAPVSGNAFTDTAVTNGQTYFYRAVAVDAGGFEGAVTNSNADCGASGPPDGPDCRRAVPKNLTPPIPPQGVSAFDTGSGTSLGVSWSANPESDIQKYLVAYGTTPGSHPTVKDVGAATSTVLAGLATGIPYYVVVSAVNTSGIQGTASVEVSATPHVFFGIAPPRTIHDLMVARNGNNLILSWGAVTTNIYGNPAVVDHYNVYRGSDPTFIPSNTLNRIAVVPAGPSPSFTHMGGALTADAGYYLVSATDADGFSSGLGSDLPTGILDLHVDFSPTPGMLRLTWTPPAVTMGGQPASIDHYTLYASPSRYPGVSWDPGTSFRMA